MSCKMISILKIDFVLFNIIEIDCECYRHGRSHKQCDNLGKCRCKLNFKGDKCDQCNEGHYSTDTDTDSGRLCTNCLPKFQYNPYNKSPPCLGND